MRVADAVFALAFLGFAALQWNDPDPALWMALYGAAALVCALVAHRPRPALRWAAGAVALVAAAWGASLAPAFARTSWDGFFGHIGMIDLAAEEAREAAGLLIVAIWLGAMVLWRRWR
jgi:hypothetical protein